MKRLLGIIAVVLALISLVIPSVAVGARGLVPNPTPSYVLTAQGTYVKGPCILKHGKSQAHPRCDMGILPVAARPGAVPESILRPFLADVTPVAAIVEPTLPPPRTT
jgi:hypothetical protein